MSNILTGIKLCKYCNCTIDKNMNRFYFTFQSDFVGMLNCQSVHVLNKYCTAVFAQLSKVAKYYWESTVTYSSLFVMLCSCFYMPLPGPFLPPYVLAKHVFYFRYNLQYSGCS